MGGANGWLTVLTLNLGEESVPSVTSQGDDLRECEHIGEVWLALIGKLILKMKTYNLKINQLIPTDKKICCFFISLF